MPSVPPLALGADRTAPKPGEVVPLGPPVVPGTDRSAPKSAEVVPPMPSVPSVAVGTDRAALKFAEVAAGPLIPSLSPPPLIPRTATLQFHAYALLDKARTLTIFDLEPLEAKAQDGDPESETTLALAYHAGTLLKQDDAEALRLLRRAANGGFVAAEEAMGIFCQSGFGIPPDKEQAVSWYTRAAQHGSKDAATNLALMY